MARVMVARLAHLKISGPSWGVPAFRDGPPAGPPSGHGGDDHGSL